MNSVTLPKNDYRYVIYTTMKNEAPYILDWVSYHLAIGFTHFAIATNDSDDGTDNLLRQLETLGILTHRNNPGPHPQGIQKHGFLRLQEVNAIKDADWLMQLDVSEYLRVDVGGGKLVDLVSAIANHGQAVSFVNQLFGDNGVTEFLDEPVIAQFTRASHPLQIVPQPVSELKTFYKNGYFCKLAPKRPLAIYDTVSKTEFVWLDADGVSVPGLIKSQISNATQKGFAFGTAMGRVNRYAVQSFEAFTNKWQRGFSHLHEIGVFTASDYWLRHNWNITSETQILKHLDASNRIKEELLLNPKLKKLHKKSVRLHRQSANTFLRKNPDFVKEIEVLKPLNFCEGFPLVGNEKPIPLRKDWLINVKLMRQKLLATHLLKYYIDSVNYGPSSTELDRK